MKKWILAMLFFYLCFLSFAQRPTKEVDALQLEHIKKDKTRYIIQGKKINYWLLEEGRKKKAVIDSIGDSFFVADGQIVSFPSIKKISSRSTGMALVNITGKVIVVSGTAVTVLGIMMINEGAEMTDDPCGSIITIMFGAVLSATGTAAVIVGAIPLLLHSKRYKIGNKWVIEKGQAQVKIPRKELNK